VIKIHLTGELKPWVSAKDIVLTVLEIFTTQGNVGCIFEYGGEGVSLLSVPERATITNMGTECGVTTSIFPSDERTKEFLKAQGREKDWVPLEADEGAEYYRAVEIDLSDIVPKVACPHSPGNVKKVRDLERLKIDQVCIGSCTNSSYRDLIMVAEILKGRTVHPDVSVVVAPGSRQVLQMITRASALEALLASGVRLQESSCGFCMGGGQSPKTEAISVRTSNRNFLGRSGTKTAQVYLVSPETAAVSSLTGMITDPRDAGIPYPHVVMPKQFIINDNLFIHPAERPEEVEVYKGPHMGQVPLNPPLPETIIGEITIKVGDEITTDHIVPSGSRMKYRANVAKYAEFVFEVIDPSFHDRATKIRDKGKYNIIVGGFSYGQGSSREHAALCPMYLGVKAVVAKSIERIHRDNLVNFGIIPFAFVSKADYDWIDQGDELEIPDIRRVLQKGDIATVINRTKNKTFEVSIDLSQREREITLVGGTLPYTKEK
jgi:aconitate hydratase